MALSSKMVWICKTTVNLPFMHTHHNVVLLNFVCFLSLYLKLVTQYKPTSSFNVTLSYKYPEKNLTILIKKRVFSCVCFTLGLHFDPILIYSTYVFMYINLNFSKYKIQQIYQCNMTKMSVSHHQIIFDI